MLVLTIRTDKPESEIGLLENGAQIAYEKWHAHRQLAETIHHKIMALLESKQKVWEDVEGIICYKGPGSFTGLRIGLSVANALAYSLGIPVAGTTKSSWIESGVEALKNKSASNTALPEYGAKVHITQQKK